MNEPLEDKPLKAVTHPAETGGLIATGRRRYGPSGHGPGPARSAGGLPGVAFLTNWAKKSH